ncbi:Cell wall-associated polypeptide CWBP200 [Porphyromonas macacae]|uniref:Cell wall-associated polypeptide CWBP200 n=1 Tax=Porphyromonas macacae TaxID=28115 RepID=A0A379E9D1_9PORP|nr:RHS repeat-associated core domain-containing protein [Porphyromonas macacae]SUB89287.1 Cell wall-associated polypeptide CWBP200 [Porphyromonas macacae]
MLKSVKRPDGEVVSFEYDPLGRRISKRHKGTTTRWVWDGNVPLHEWTDEEDITTWVFEEGGFVPCAKLQNGESYSIITDYLGTPTEMYNSDGKKTWSAELDIYGCVRTFRGRSLSDCPFRYQGQYEDEETGLYYNRFRYYSPDEGMYISQDPIRLAGGNPTLYAYVHDTNAWMDPWGLRSFTQAVGDIGEKYYTGVLKTQGFKIIDVKYGSNNGIDILAKNPQTGKYDFFEVKSSTVGSFNLSPDQMSSKEFVQTRLLSAREKGVISPDLYDDIVANMGERKLVNVDISRADNGKLYASNAEIKDWH